MSSSSLWLIDNNFYGVEDKEYKNSWLVSPIVWDVLMEKYLKNFNRSPYIDNGTKPIGYLSASMTNQEISCMLNDKLNNSDNQIDRVAWELSNQQIFNSNDKKFVAECIKQFLTENKEYSIEYGIHIFERFNEVASDILRINNVEHPFFVWKSTSCDDNVEYWFSKYNEKTDDYESKSLKEWNDIICEFVIIKNGIMIDFKNNVDYFS